jgi:O-antigen/teichoic acid export membrane protein
MSLKGNVLANYASQLYVTLAALVMVPFYVRHMGAEAYGLVGFFAMMQGWLQLMDMGLSSTLSREVTCYRAGTLSEARMNQILRAFVALFLVAGALAAIAIATGSRWIAVSWLQARTLSPELLARCISLMGLAAALRWLSGLYRGIVNGCERQGWLAGCNVAIATLRYLGVLALFAWIGVDPLTFFFFQLLVTLCELAVLWWQAGRLIPGARAFPSLALEPLQAMWRFSGSLALVSMIWVLITQTDKLVLSRTLTLGDYGLFTMAVMAANGVNLVASPISGALLPRLTFLAAQGDGAELRRLYRKATQLVSVIVWPVASVMAAFAEPLLFAWTKDAAIAHKAAPVLFWYALGNACLGVAAFQYYLQFAHGKLSLHMIGNAVFVVLLIPGVLWASLNYGAVGAGRMWFGENLLFFLLWTWIVHRRFAPGLHWRWLGQDVLPVALSALLAALGVASVVSLSGNRVMLIGQLLILGLCSLAAAAAASSTVRAELRRSLAGRLRQ